MNKLLTCWSLGVHADLQEKQLISWVSVKDCSTSPQTVRGQEDKSNRPFQDIFITSINMLSSLILWWNGWCVLLVMPRPSASWWTFVWTFSCVLFRHVCARSLKPVYVHSSEKSACCEFSPLTPHRICWRYRIYRCELVVSTLTKPVHV